MSEGSDTGPIPVCGGPPPWPDPPAVRPDDRRPAPEASASAGQARGLDTVIELLRMPLGRRSRAN